MTAHQDFSTATNLKAELASRTRATRAHREDAVAADSWRMGRNDPLPDLRLEQRGLATLQPAKRRPRRAEPAHIAEIERSIATLGFSVPLLIEANGTIIDGHIRYDAACSLGLETVPCIIVDYLSEAGLAALKIAVNRLAEKGSWDLDILRHDLLELAEAEIDLGVTGFSAPELDIIVSLDDDKSDKPAAEEDLTVDKGPPTSHLGDLWQLGPHRLLCADSTSIASYDRLMGSATASCIFTDPPYNIPIAGFVSPQGKHADFAMGVGEMSAEDFRTFLASVLGHAKASLTPGGVAFACMDWRNIHLLMLAGKDAGLSHINTAVWNKGVGGMGGLYRSAHELIAVFANGTKAATNNIELGKHGRDRTNVWSYPGANRRGSTAAAFLGDHPTPKPVELVRDALLDVTKRGDIILDPFLGSGTTIIAAQACGRVGYGIELDLGYADLVVRRWQGATGAAILDKTGETFAEVQARRAQEAAADAD